MASKQCSACAQVLPLVDFGIDRSTSDGRHRWCRACNRERCRAYYRRTRAFQIERVQHWRKHRHEPGYKALRRARDPETKQLVRELKAIRAAAYARKQRCELTRDEWQQIRQQACFYCGKPGPGLVNDHLDPVALGGEYAAWNIVKACPACNRAKHDTDLLTYAERMNRLDWLERVDARVIQRLRTRAERALEVLTALGILERPAHGPFVARGDSEER